MYKACSLLAALAVGIALLAAVPAGAANVKVTPLGSHDGEFCALDRALIFEDPNGTRVLYDAGRTVRGPNDPRLGKIDAVILSHVHGDHIGDMIQPSANAGECGKPDFSVKTTPNSNTVDIAIAKKATLVIGGEQVFFFIAKMKQLGGDPKQVRLVRFGASATVGGVTFTTVPAVHSNGLSPEFLHGDHAKGLAENGLTAAVGPPAGYVVKFTNGLVVYLSGDTGITAEQDVVVRQHYRARLAVMNIGDVFTTGPTEAAWVMNELVKPASVIVSHANQPSTKGGKVIPGTRTDVFIKATKAPVHVPLSGRTMEFDDGGKCRAGC
jgi:L-ascorbate metabolism protein UlaG (beta-lactamase superfamily)